MNITVEELKQKLDNKEEFIFIDVREPYEYEEFNLGANLIPLGEIMEKLGDFEDNKSDEIVIHCRSGNRSMVAQHFFIESGFSNVKNLKGGVLEWEEKFGRGSS